MNIVQQNFIFIHKVLLFLRIILNNICILYEISTSETCKVGVKITYKVRGGGLKCAIRTTFIIGLAAY